MKSLNINKSVFAEMKLFKVTFWVVSYFHLKLFYVEIRSRFKLQKYFVFIRNIFRLRLYVRKSAKTQFKYKSFDVKFACRVSNFHEMTK